MYVIYNNQNNRVFLYLYKSYFGLNAKGGLALYALFKKYNIAMRFQIKYDFVPKLKQQSNINLTTQIINIVLSRIHNICLLKETMF